jgi:hypothetical protein
MNPYDQLCIKSDVCDMAVCDGVNVCKHAAQDTKESTNSSHNMPRDEIRLLAESIVTCLSDGQVDNAKALAESIIAELSPVG